MAVVSSSIDVRDYMRVVFSRAWWLLYVTLGVVALVYWLSFFHAERTYVGRNEIAVTDKYSGNLTKDIVRIPDWVSRTRKAELEFKRPVPAGEILAEASAAVGVVLSDEELTSMRNRLKDDLKVVYLKSGDFIELEYRASDARLAAAVLNLFMKRMIDYCVRMQVDELNTEVRTLAGTRERLAAEVAAAEKKLDTMKTIPPELHLAASTMSLLGSSKQLSTVPSTDQAVHVFLQLQKDIIDLDAQIAEVSQQLVVAGASLAQEPKTIPVRRKTEQSPSFVKAVRRRDELNLKLAALLANSTAMHPHVKELQAELKGLDAFLQNASTTVSVAVVFEANPRRGELDSEIDALEGRLRGLKQRRSNMEANADKWRLKLDKMPSELRTVREATLEYEKKFQNLSHYTASLVKAQIARSLEIDQAGTYYTPQWDLTPVPGTYEKPNHLVHLALGLVLGLVASVFAVYAMEFADHSVKDQRDLKLYTKAAVLGVVSDYNQLKSVAVRAARARVRNVRTWLLALLFLALAAFLAWNAWSKWPRPNGREGLPASLSAATLDNIEKVMGMYASEAYGPYDFDALEAPELDVTAAIAVPADPPQPLLSE